MATAVEAHLTANADFPPPELVLQFCPELLLGGLLPWHCRITHFVHMGQLRHASADGLQRALLEYSTVQQRQGR